MLPTGLIVHLVRKEGGNKGKNNRTITLGGDALNFRIVIGSYGTHFISPQQLTVAVLGSTAENLYICMKRNSMLGILTNRNK